MKTETKTIKPYKPKRKANKHEFIDSGVIFEMDCRGSYIVSMVHWPYCGMSSGVCRRLAKWLLKRADDLDKKNKLFGGEM